MEKVSQNGVITVEESKTAETYSEVVEGMQFDRDILPPYMVTDSEKMEAVIDDPYILITDKKISIIRRYCPCSRRSFRRGASCSSSQRTWRRSPCDYHPQQTARHVHLRVRKGARLAATGAKKCSRYSHPDRRQVISSELGMELKEATLDMLGTARQVKASKENTIIVDGAGDSAEIKARIAQIKNEHDISTSDYDKEKLQERLAKLSGGVAVIKVARHRDRDEGKEAPHRRRAERYARGR
jgi:chaperonin GroEL